MEKKIPSDTKILLVDDEKYMRQLVSRMLTGLGVSQCGEASDGVQALSLLNTSEVTYDLVLLDIDMPGMNGFQCLEAIRSAMSEEVRKVPVVMLTGHSNTDAITQCVPLGIHGWIAKPASIANLEKQITRGLTMGPIDVGKV